MPISGMPGKISTRPKHQEDSIPSRIRTLGRLLACDKGMALTTVEIRMQTKTACGVDVEDTLQGIVHNDHKKEKGSAKEKGRCTSPT